MRRLVRASLVGPVVFLGVAGQPTVSAEEPSGVEIAFRDVTVEAGLDGIAGDRFSWADVDGDGDPDLLVGGLRLFRNDTTRKSGQSPAVRFTEMTVAAGTDKGRGESGIFVDMDGDGRPDIVTTGGSLLLQGKSGAFTESSAAWGLDLKRPAPAVGAGDVDGDGYPDLLFGGGEDMRDGQFLFAERRFYRNLGGKRLGDETALHDLKEPRYGRAVVFADFDRDGDLDAYLGNYRLSPNELFVNEGGTLRDRAKEAGVQGRYDPEAVLDPTTGQRFGPRYGHTIGASWADLDGDGDLDLFVPNLAHKFVGPTEQDGKPAFDMRGYLCDDSAIYRNEGGPRWTFTDARPDSGVPPKPVGGPDVFQGDELWSNAACGDLDGDGLPEVYVAQVYDLDYSHSLLLHNDGDLKFTDVSEKAGTRRYDSYGGAFADVDGDGDLDLVVGGRPDPKGKPTMRLLMNETPPGPWLAIRLKGRKPNLAALGAQVVVETDKGVLVRQVECSMGSHAQANEPVCRFGLRGRTVKAAWIRWPGNLIQEVKPKLSGAIDVSYPDGVVVPPVSIPAPKGVVEGTPVDWVVPAAPSGWAWSFDVSGGGASFVDAPTGEAVGTYTAPAGECRARLTNRGRGLAREVLVRFAVSAPTR